jgi:hypothetical protein
MKFIAITKHDSGADGSYASRDTYEECVEIVHAFFLAYGFEIRDGKPFDDGHDDGKNGGYIPFNNVIMHNGKIARFMHCDGDGPIAEIRESE